jgi:hypothetical protein
MRNLITLMLLMFVHSVVGQGVGIGTTQPHSSAALEIKDNAKGILIPRMTMAQRMLIPSPAEGLMVYQSDSTKGYWFFDGSQWLSVFSKNAFGSYLSTTTLSVQEHSKSGSGGYLYLLDSAILLPGHFAEVNFYHLISGGHYYRTASLNISNLDGDYYATNSQVEAYSYNSNTPTAQGTIIFKNQSDSIKKYYIYATANSNVPTTYSAYWQLTVKSY